jgi:plasmid stabilization system protein ParE
VPRVIVTPRAIADPRDLTLALGLPPDTLARVQRSLKILERFPLAGRALTGRWEGTRFLIGPWPWMILLYIHDAPGEAVYVVAVHDGRNSSSATRRSR